MYKTVRHGENSLQYTILPQTEEVLSNSGLRGKGRDYSPSIHVRRTKRKSTVKYIVLVIIGIIIALALASVPLYVINGSLYARRASHEDNGEAIITTAPLAPTGREIVKSRKKELKTFQENVSILNTKINAYPTSIPKVASTTLPVAKITPPPWSMPALRSWQSSTSSSTQPPSPVISAHEYIPLITPSDEPSTHLFDRLSLEKSWEKDVIIRPTVAPEVITIRTVFKHYTQGKLPSVSKDNIVVTPQAKFDDVLITTKATTPKVPSTTNGGSKFNDLMDTLLSADSNNEFKESLQMDEVFSLPPLKPEFESDDDDVIVSKTTGSEWYGARWPFVDTSSYFQWTGYSSGDNLLLPLLVAAMSSLALVVLLGLAVRHFKRNHTSSAQVGKITADLQTDDNTNLLTAENPEDPEE